MTHCVTCPFGDYSKIPDHIKSGADYTNQEVDKQGVIDGCKRSNLNWTCHDNFDNLCAGYVAYCKENGVQYKGKKAFGEVYDLKAQFDGKNYVPY